MAKQVVVFDYGSGNVHSALKALERSGASVELSSDPVRCRDADGLVVPGVGAFASVMAALKDSNGPAIIENRVAGGRSVLGICVGLQVMFDTGLEHAVETEGLGQWPGVVDKLEADILPHMGWNTVEVPAGSTLFQGVEHERFYFVHSYAAKNWTLTNTAPLPEPVVTYATYGERFIAAIENGPLCATQFHPEKSGEAGLTLLSNWVNSLS